MKLIEALLLSYTGSTKAFIIFPYLSDVNGCRDMQEKMASMERIAEVGRGTRQDKTMTKEKG